MKTSRYLIALTFAGIVAAPTFSADAPTNWKELCAKCHGDDGVGNTKMGRKLSIRNLSDPSVQAKFTDEDAVKAMKDGVKDEKGKVTMKPIEGLTPDDMQALAKYVRGMVKK
jgi:cytochrome c553